MSKTLIKSRLLPNKNKIKNKLESDSSKSNLLPNLQSFEQKQCSENGFVVCNYFFSTP